jgi:hypothetical protein
MDQAYNATVTPADLNALKARLSAVIDAKPEKTGTSTASTTAPREKRQALLNATDTPMTARSDASDIWQGNAFSVVNDIVDTCVELECTQLALKRTGRKLNGTMTPAAPMTPSQIWSARAAMAAAASAEAASAAAEVAAAASAEAAREAAKCAAAAKAATGRYNHLVDYVMSARSRNGDVTMKPGGLPALEGPSPSRAAGPGASSSSGSAAVPRQPDPRGEAGPRRPSIESTGSESEDDPEDGISQAALEKKANKEKYVPEIPLTAPVGLEEWRMTVEILDLDPDEATNIFKSICEEENVPFDPNVKFKMIEFLESLHIEPDDDEGVENFVDALVKARKELASGKTAGMGNFDDKAAMRAMFDKVVRNMDFNNIPAANAWKFIEGRMKIREEGGLDDKHIFSSTEMQLAAGFKDKPEEFCKRVAQYMIIPPIMNSTGGQVGSKEICIRRVNEIVKDCKERGIQWTDPDFNLRQDQAFCLYVDKSQPGYDCTVAVPSSFHRLSTIVKKGGGNAAMGAMGSLFGGGGGGKKKKSNLKPKVFKGEILPGDVVQGQIGTCFLLGAIGAIACNREESLTRIFVKYDVDVGVYGIRFCLDGEWTHVLVDDWMPCDVNGDLLYARCKDPQEVWVPLIEKAFCKLHTCYEMCDGGEATEALTCFFGGVTGKIQVKKQHRKHPDRFFKLLKNAKDRGWLLTTSFVAQPGAKAAGSGKCGEDMLPSGLVGGHAYSVLKIVEAQGHQLIQCRNPWGSGEWTGEWSDQDKAKWTPQMKKLTGYEGKDDGKFWMHVKDFVMNSGGVDYARTFGPNWKKTTQYAHFSSKPMMATAKRNFKAKAANQLGFSKGDQVEIKEIQGKVFWGHLKGKNKGDPKGFPGGFVRMNDRNVIKFELRATPTPGSKDPVTAVIMLMQRNIILQRRWKAIEELGGQHYKDLDYSEITLVVIGPGKDGKDTMHVKKMTRKRCIWGEIEMPGGGLWKVYALCNDGKGAPCIVRTYLKGGTLEFKEIKGAKFSEVSEHLMEDDD